MLGRRTCMFTYTHMHQMIMIQYATTSIEYYFKLNK